MKTKLLFVYIVKSRKADVIDLFMFTCIYRQFVYFDECEIDFKMQNKLYLMLMIFCYVRVYKRFMTLGFLVIDH